MNKLFSGKRLKYMIYFGALVTIGSAGFYSIGGAEWTIVDSIYMTIITLSTVGYGEVHQLTDLGKILDPTADRLLLLVAAFSLIVEGSVPWWFAVMALIREGLVGLGALVLAALGARRIEVTWWGKTATFSLLWAFPCFLAGQSTAFAHEWFAVAAWIFGVPGLVIAWWSAAGYLPEARRALRDGRANK